MISSNQQKNKNLLRAVDTRLANKWCLSPFWLVETDLDAEFNRKLFEEVFQFYKDIDTGASVKSDLIAYDSPTFKHLQNVIMSSVGDAVADFENVSRPTSISELVFEMCSAWITIMPPGEFYMMHTHPNAILTGTYYISIPENSGDFAFLDTQEMAIDPINGKAKLVRVPPKEGNLVFFPAYVMHEVQKNNSNDVRISITFDLKLKENNLKVTDKNAARAIVDSYERYQVKAN
mgnify:CR=1 FL=1